MMADLTNISIHENYKHFTDVLEKTKGVDFDSSSKSTSNEEFAIYFYPQDLINTNSNIPFFVASPKLFAIMNDSEKLEKDDFSGLTVNIRKVSINNKSITICKFGDLAEIKRGIDTGKNEDYLLQKSKARGTYKNIQEYLNFVISPSELIEICSNKRSREVIIKEGFSIEDNSGQGFYYKGKYIVPFDKGGASDTEIGFIPNYLIETEYFIDWSSKSVESLYKRSSFKSAKANLRNAKYWFTKGFTYSARGVYSPSYRINSNAVFDSNGSSIFPKDDLKSSSESLLAFLASKYLKFILKNYCGHTIASEVDELKEMPIVKNNCERDLKLYVSKIMENQKSDTRYDYASNEQIEIDRLVYEAYGLNADDVLEVENWYARRYPKLSQAQKANLRALGKSDDYLKLYGLK